MKLFKLTIAEDEVEKRTEGYTNLMSMLYGFTIAFAVTLMSGFWYFLVPRDINWNASQIVLVLHLAGGLISFLLFLIYFILHQKDKQQSLWMTLFPWSIQHDSEETRQHFHQRQLGLLLSWLLLFTYVSGLLIAIPGFLFALGWVWMQGYYTSQIISKAHLWSSVILIPVMFTHMLWLTRQAHKKGGMTCS